MLNKKVYEILKMDLRKDTHVKPDTAVIYTHTVLSGSMTFIKSHADAMRRFVLDGRDVYVANDSPVFGIAREYAFRRWGWAPKLVSALRGKDPAIVHAHFGTAGPAGLALAKQLDVPLVVTFHGADATLNHSKAASSRRGRDLIRGKGKLIDGAARFIAVSNYIRDRLLEQGYPENKVSVHRNGINLNDFSPKVAEIRKKQVLFVGRFVEKKGVRVLVDAAAKLREAGIVFELILVGDGPLRESIAADCEKAGIDCRFTGFLPIDEVRNWLAQASVVAVPSITAADGDSEGLPTILLESQAMETPVVATYHSGIPEGVVNNETAELVQPGDSEALASSLSTFLNSPDKISAFGKAGRRFVADNFGLEEQVSVLEGIYNELIEEHGKARVRHSLKSAPV